ncbi:class II aldolase/adducin domain-containing protein [Mycena leptocephala]|nr:class II aldolase/adducin domain-containing protein [Mycena leptocephala]
MSVEQNHGAPLPATTFRGKMPGPPVFKTKLEEREFLKFRLAQAFRIFGNLGYGEGIAGHITVRDPIRSDCFWVNPFGLHFKLIQPSDLLLVDHKGEILEESGQKDGPFRILNLAAFMIHSTIHAARPDVVCAAHTLHIREGILHTWETLDPISHDACAFYDAVILQNHGLLVATSSIEATLHFYISLERACQVQLLAETAAATHEAKIVPINPAQAAETSKIIGSQGAGWFSGRMEFYGSRAGGGRQVPSRLLENAISMSI